MPWLLSRFEIKKFGKTAIQEVISLYSHDFPKDSIYFPLESFQVGQLVRQGKKINIYKQFKFNYIHFMLGHNLIGSKLSFSEYRALQSDAQGK